MLGSTCMCHQVLTAHQAPALQGLISSEIIFQISFGSTSSPVPLSLPGLSLPAFKCNFYHPQVQDRRWMLLQVKSLGTPQCLSPQLVTFVTVKLSLFCILRLSLFFIFTFPVQCLK